MPARSGNRVSKYLEQSLRAPTAEYLRGSDTEHRKRDMFAASASRIQRRVEKAVAYVELNVDCPAEQEKYARQAQKWGIEMNRFKFDAIAERHLWLRDAMAGDNHRAAVVSLLASPSPSPSPSPHQSHRRAHVLLVCPQVWGDYQTKLHEKFREGGADSLHCKVKTWAEGMALKHPAKAILAALPSPYRRGAKRTLAPATLSGCRPSPRRARKKRRVCAARRGAAFESDARWAVMRIEAAQWSQSSVAGYWRNSVTGREMVRKPKCVARLEQDAALCVERSAHAERARSRRQLDMDAVDNVFAGELDKSLRVKAAEDACAEDELWQAKGPLMGVGVFGKWTAPSLVAGTVVAFLPPARGRQGKVLDGKWALWRVRHTIDGDLEDLEWHEVAQGTRAFRCGKAFATWRASATAAVAARAAEEEEEEEYEGLIDLSYDE